MKLTASVDSTRWNAMLRELGRVAGGRKMQELLRPEGAKVLSLAAKYTPTPHESGAIARAEQRLDRKFNTYRDGRAGQSNKQAVAGVRYENVSSGSEHISIAPRAGNVWFGRPGQWKRMNDPQRRWSYSRFDRYESEEAKRKIDLRQAKARAAKNIKQSKGLGKQSWYQIAEDIGVAHLMKNVPGYAQKAKTQRGRSVKSGEGSEGVSSAGAFIRLVNKSPILAGNKGQGAAILQRALNARVTAFKTDLRNDVFSDVKLRASRYPGIAFS